MSDGEIHQHAYLKDRRAYVNNHSRVIRERGRAGDLACVECDRPARDWAHTHETDPADPANYRPLCRRCHQQYDGSNRKTEEHKAKLAEARAHQVLSEAQLAALLARAKAPKTPEHRARIAAGMRAARARRGDQWTTK